MMTPEQQNTELKQRIIELMRENRFLKNEFMAVKSSLGTIKESTEATHQIIVDLEQQNAELLRENAELVRRVANLTAIAEAVAHIWVNFGYGPYQLTEEHAKLAREFLEDY